jgi:hypothetical protein
MEFQLTILHLKHFSPSNYWPTSIFFFKKKKKQQHWHESKKNNETNKKSKPSFINYNTNP